MLSLKQKKQQEAYSNDIETSPPRSKTPIEKVNEKVQITVEKITKTMENICK
jgi:hypothetical protein